MEWRRMATDDDRQRRAAGPSGLSSLADESARNHLKVIGLLDRLDRGEISAEDAKKQILMLYQLGLGSWLRALGVTDASAASEVVETLRHDLSAIKSGLADDKTRPQRRPREKGDEESRPPLLKGKDTDVLKRELRVLRKLTPTDQPSALSELSAEMPEKDGKRGEARLISTLKRLVDDSHVDRPAKGYYARTGSSKAYMDAVVSELESRGESTD
jgi:hypothetical protein